MATSTQASTATRSCRGPAAFTPKPLNGDAAKTETELAWTQGVLFDDVGNELGYTEPGDTVEGEYSVYHENKIYTVIVKVNN